jgi:hypothetical protein
MLDLNNLLTNQKADIQIFPGRAQPGVPTWQKWIKPRGVSFVHMFLMGAGGGGGAGFRNTVAGGAAGGGGGGSGAFSSILFLADNIPDQLFLSIAAGGPGGAVPLQGQTANDSYITIFPQTLANYTLMFARGGGAGGTPTATTGGAGGVAGSVCTVAEAPLSKLGMMPVGSNVGFAGDAGQSGAASNNLEKTFPTTGALTLGGCGGGGLGTTGNLGGMGGWYRIDTPYPNIAPLVTTGAAGGSGTGTGAATYGAPGSNGIQLMPNVPLFTGGFGGGGGGGSGDAGGNGGGRGGRGGFGCGGGGGGGNASGRTQGFGGDGGPGLAIIVSY